MNLAICKIMDLVSRIYQLSIFRHIFRLIPSLLAAKVSLFFPFYRAGKSHNLPAPLIVSLTSYPERFSSLHLTLKCLLSQNVAPDLVILWIAHADKELLTPNITKLSSSGLVIDFCDDLRSYKKIIPTLERQMNAYIVTADDDVYYGRSWLKQLVTVSLANPKDVVCHRSHTIRLGTDNLPLPYNNWILDSQQFEASPLTFQTGVGGVLYPPNVFYRDVLNISLFTELCFHADDIWLYWMMRMNGRVSRRVDSRFRMYCWPGTQKNALWLSNMVRCKNDIDIDRMLNHYGNAIFGHEHD